MISSALPCCSAAVGAGLYALAPVAHHQAVGLCLVSILHPISLAAPPTPTFISDCPVPSYCTAPVLDRMCRAQGPSATGYPVPLPWSGLCLSSPLGRLDIPFPCAFALSLPLILLALPVWCSVCAVPPCAHQWLAVWSHGEVRGAVLAAHLAWLRRLPLWPARLTII